jgi:hypothetical protein
LSNSFSADSYLSRLGKIRRWQKSVAEAVFLAEYPEQKVVRMADKKVNIMLKNTLRVAKQKTESQPADISANCPYSHPTKS